MSNKHKKKELFFEGHFLPPSKLFSGEILNFTKGVQKINIKVCEIIETCLKIFISSYMIEHQQAHSKNFKNNFFLLQKTFLRLEDALCMHIIHISEKISIQHHMPIMSKLYAYSIIIQK